MSGAVYNTLCLRLRACAQPETVEHEGDDEVIAAAEVALEPILRYRELIRTGTGKAGEGEAADAEEAKADEAAPNPEEAPLPELPEG